MEWLRDLAAIKAQSLLSISTEPSVGMSKGLPFKSSIKIWISNPTLGRPVVLYPDPEKDPTRDAVVQALWEEFDAALEGATHVLVLGHSLRDSALVAKLNEAAENSEVAVCVLVRKGTESVGAPEFVVEADELERMKALMPAQASFLPSRFEPGATSILSPISIWIRGELQSKAA